MTVAFELLRGGVGVIINDNSTTGCTYKIGKKKEVFFHDLVSIPWQSDSKHVPPKYRNLVPLVKFHGILQLPSDTKYLTTLGEMILWSKQWGQV